MQLPKHTRKSLIAIAAMLWAVYIWGITYSIVYEKDKIAIDDYNFEQLNKAKPTLDWLKKNSQAFATLNEFNQQYNLDIKPMQNCYYVSNYNGRKPYIFWFQLQSVKYKLLFFTHGAYSYPSYDLPYEEFCVSWYWCYDHFADDFNYTITHPCRN